MPEKKPVSDDLLWETRDRLLQNRKVLVQGICIAFTVMIIGFLAGAVKYSIAVGLTAVIFSVGALILNARSKIDETATMMQIPIHHVDSGLTGSYAVCYLPDGRYELRLSGDSSFANTLLVVQYHRITTWEAVHLNEDNSVPSTLDLDDEPAEAPAGSPAAEEPENTDTESSAATERT